MLTISPELRHQIQISFLSEAVLVTILIAGLISCCGFLFQRTFKLACLLQGLCVLAVAGLQTYGGQMRAALLEIPFFLATLAMIYFGYPFPHTRKS